MSTFFEKNKRKSVLALLLLFLKWRRGLGPMLLMLCLVMFLFIAPANLMGIMVDGISRLPGGSRVAAGITWLAGRAGLWRGAGDESFDDLLAAFRAARADRSQADGLWRNILSGRGGRAGSSVGLVRGSRSDLDGGAKLGAGVKGGESIGGILTPEEASKGAQGVEIQPGDLDGERAGLVQSAYAEGAPGSGVMGRLGASGLSGSAAYAGKNFFSGANTSASFDKVQGALNSGAAGKAATPKVSAQEGRLQKNPNRRADTRSGFGGRGPMRHDNKALAQLADGRVRTQIARDPYCTSTNGCMPEYASANAGAIYDGNAASANNLLADGLVAPEINGIDVPNPNVPSTGDVGALEDEANKLLEDAKKCQEARERHDAAKSRHMQNIQTISNRMNSACDGSCSKSKQRRCERMGDQMKSECRALDREMRAEYNECPLMQQDGPYQPQDCNG